MIIRLDPVKEAEELAALHSGPTIKMFCAEYFVHEIEHVNPADDTPPYSVAHLVRAPGGKSRET